MISRRCRLLPYLVLLGLLLCSATSAAAVPLVRFEGNTYISILSQPVVYGGQSVAQSFVASVNYTLVRIQVYVADSGTDDALTITLVRDSAGVPSSSPSDRLGLATNNTPAAAQWANFDLSPNVNLAKGTRYWIVATNTAATSANGYLWYFVNADVYSGGSPAFNAGGFGGPWTSFTGDMTFQNFGLDANMTTAIKADASEVRINTPVHYTIYFNNTGGATASKMWVNATLPSNLTRVSDSAAATGGTALGPAQWLFQNVTPGAHSFFLNVTPTGTPTGVTLTTTVAGHFTSVKEVVIDGGRSTSTLLFRGPNFSPTMVASPSQLRRGKSLQLWGYFNNTGNELAPTAWLNFTLPPFMAYVGDDVNATAAVANRSLGANRLLFVLSNVSVGTHNYTVQLYPLGDPPVGTSFPSNLTLDYRDIVGNPFPRASASAQSVLVGPRITASLGLSSASATPGDTLIARVDYGNGGAWTTQATVVWLNLTLANDLNFAGASSGGSWDAFNRTLRWSLGTLGVGQGAVLWANSTVRWPLPDGSGLPFSLRVEYRDDQGNPMAPVLAAQNPQVHIPILSLVGTLDKASLEANDILLYSAAFNNTGSGTTGYAWVNVTLDASLSFTAFSLEGAAGSLLSFQTSNGTLHFALSGLQPGPHALVLDLQPSGRLQDGTRLGVTSRLVYGDLNQNRAANLVAGPVVATIRAPSLVASLGISSTSALPGGRVKLFITVQNTGSATARDFWANLTLDLSLTEVATTAPATPEVLGPRYSYHLRNLTAGSVLLFNIDMAVLANATAGRSMYFIMTVDYDDSRGDHLDTVRPPEVAFTLLQAPSRGTDPMTLVPPLGLVALVGLALFLVVRYVREPEIEEVLLVHKEGLLMAQASRSETHGKDRDILASSLVAVKDFIREAFHEETSKELDRMDLGDYKLLIRRGRGAFLVVALQGSPTRRTQARVRETLGAIESLLGPKLEEWNGDTEEVMGVIPVLENLLHRGRPPSRDQPPPPPPIAQFPPQ